MEHEGDGDTNCNWSTRYNHQGIDRGTGGFGNKRTSGDYLNYSLVEIIQNTTTTNNRKGDPLRTVQEIKI